VRTPGWVPTYENRYPSGRLSLGWGVQSQPATTTWADSAFGRTRDTPAPPTAPSCQDVSTDLDAAGPRHAVTLAAAARLQTTTVGSPIRAFQPGLPMGVGAGLAELDDARGTHDRVQVGRARVFPGSGDVRGNQTAGASSRTPADQLEDLCLSCSPRNSSQIARFRA
jgi:hypothetical protein